MVIGLAQLLFTLMASTITKHTMDLTMVIYLLQGKFKKPDKERVLLFLLFDKNLSTKYLFDKKIVDQNLSTNDMITLLSISVRIEYIQSVDLFTRILLPCFFDFQCYSAGFGLPKIKDSSYFYESIF